MWPLAGNEQAISYLKGSLDKGALSHAYLFTGPPHVGKMTLAVLLAQAVNCLSADKPCGECDNCRKIAAGAHPDVQIIRLLTAEDADDKKARSELVIEQIRKLQHWASLPPYEGLCRVFIFEQAELLNEEAANCLLKTLEEPLPGVIFALLAPDTEAVPETVASRCQRLELRRVPAPEIEDLLLCRGLSPERAGLLARLASGAPGWAVNAMEHEEEFAERAARMNRLLDLVSSGYEERFEAAESMAGRGASSRNDVAASLAEWLGLWRDIMLIKAGQIEGIANLDLKDRLTALAEALNLSEIRLFIASLGRAGVQARQNVNARLLLEVLMLDMPRVDKARLKR
jgi:DNA polymerase-3 subunit delta'